jgi:hypothetical protein
MTAPTKPLDVRGDESCTYVVQFSSGVIKVGHSWQPKGRIATHAAAAAVHGVSVTRTWFSPPHINTIANESALIEFAKGRFALNSGNEYFANADFDALVDFAASLSMERAEERPRTGRGTFPPAKVAPEPPTAPDDTKAKYHRGAWERLVNEIVAGRVVCVGSDQWAEVYKEINSINLLRGLLAALFGQPYPDDFAAALIRMGRGIQEHPECLRGSREAWDRYFAGEKALDDLARRPKPVPIPA